MPKLTRDDGIELYWEEEGEGPLVLLAPYWSGHPSTFENLKKELVTDHRVLRYDARGTGESTRAGPHDTETGVADMAAIVESAGGDAVVVAFADACPKAVRIAATRPDLVKAVVTPGTAPLSIQALQDSDVLLSSQAVIDGFLEMMATDYRGALRSLLTQTNPQMEELEVRERVARQAEYCPAETGLDRIHAWIRDDASEPARAIGDRLVVVYSDEMGGAWLPQGDEMARIVAERLPEARLEPVPDGVVSRPDMTAAIIRDLAAASESAKGEK
jgi:pimeloyl-ACP methyl ester carboxylesterase